MSTKHPSRVLHCDDERADGNSLIVELKAGFKFNIDPLVPNHVAGFDTAREALAGVRRSVPCDCAECRATAKATGGTT